MINIIQVVSVVDANCIGCKQCDQVCPTEAIKTVDRLARVDTERCTGCNKCIEACMDHRAIKREFLDAPRHVSTDCRTVDRAAMERICAAARLDPQESICLCTATTAGEVAAAILKGGTTPEAVSTMTGVRGVCAIWCTGPVMRLLEAAEVKVARSPRDWRVYPEHAGMAIGIWSVSAEVADKYPEYRIRENQERLKHARIEVPMFANIERTVSK
ncbi:MULTISPECIES: (2Fe-2S)-binding protein [unclassified Burkholderia]|uniref:(2Fe-2S)-binding protein n=1 Tax=unclassified Burkholderia TaxID=2613784 RepID=UPI000F575883|nr:MULTISPECIES: (2Fe-2S)-binding protein [unclassified Burkholderia]RQR30157.1 4Fe-4S dicluster domain-containing protein [Burkholderia sp. Bp9142]RQR50039.1 4Fe-4S dicluster domain-containing protein [Burkholderia sp. Bp9140]